MIHVYPYAESLNIALANLIVNNITDTLKVQDRFSLLLSGGSTPQNLYKKLASPAWATSVDWNRIYVFWGDERYVPHEHDQNNAHMAMNIFLDKVNIPRANVHRIRTDIPLKESAKQYETLLHQYFPEDKSFDLALLGLGEDGHTLSLFPGSEGLNTHAWVYAEKNVTPNRISLTPAVVNLSSYVVFLVAGQAKAPVFAEISNDEVQPAYPAQYIKPANGNLHWFIDKAVNG